jgi:phosphopantothenoylcysteine decarboxylase/phosphopantothenate--cysteine ligase
MLVDLSNKNIVIAITGSIAIYKSLELIRLFIKSNANVKVVLTPSAKKFITPLTFEAISQNRVLDDENENWSSSHNHIGLANWADIFIIAPTTANTINSLNHGVANNILLQTALALPKTTPKILAPSANTNMIEANQTQASIKMLKLLGYEIALTQTKLLACNSNGNGAMAEPYEIYYKSAREILKEHFWENRNVVISGGGTIEKIDDVRYISNFSSGLMSNSLVLALYLKGARCCIVHTHNIENLPNDIHKIEVESSNEMYEYLKKSLIASKNPIKISPSLVEDREPYSKKEPFLFMVAAVSDYIVSTPNSGKTKKDAIGKEWNINLKENIDILSSLKEIDGIKRVGFKLETNKDIASNSAKNMINRKDLDYVCLNIIDENNNFGSKTNIIELFSKTKSLDIFSGDKLDISFKIINSIKDDSIA